MGGGVAGRLLFRKKKCAIMSYMETIRPKTWVEINQDNLMFNVAQFRKRIGERVRFMAVVKSNAYGHGANEVVSLLRNEVDAFGVDSLDEALEIKDSAGERPIVILGYTLLENLASIVENGFEQVVANFETLEKLAELTKELNTPARVHLKIETGTSRQGIFLDDLNKFLALIKSNEKLVLAGVSTHYANIEDTTDSTFAEAQLKRYTEAVSLIESLGFKNFARHTASSAAAILFPDTYFDLVRVGISLYGLWPSKETIVSSKQKNIDFVLKPVLAWKTRIAQLKTLPAGSFVSYGCTEKVERETKIAVLPIGYRDGFDRGLSSIGQVLIGGKFCKILGRICMNMTIVEMSNVENAKLEDEVVLIGRQGENEITAESLAAKIGSINYEVVTRINSQIKRIID
jgi:alanine racemase